MVVIVSSFEDGASDFFKGRASACVLDDKTDMKTSGWRQRLMDAIDGAGLSKRAVSIKSGNGPGYVHSVLAEGKDPSLENIFKVCDAIPVDPIWILHGVDASPGDVEILRAMRQSPEKRQAIIALLTDPRQPG